MCVLAFSVMIVNGAEQRPTGKNCDLQLPPKDSGEDLNHKVIQKIYPRAREISKDYTGCQILWIVDENSWITIAVVAIERGYAVRVWSPYETDPAQLSCRYKEGQIIQGDAQRCPHPDFLIIKSLPPGCIEQISKDGRLPRGCIYE
jgi:hypothetical protein